MILLLVFAGIDTNRNQLGLGMSNFLDHPEQWARRNGYPTAATPAR